MKRRELGDITCSLAGALAEVGDPWTLLIVKELMLRNRRFDGIAAQTGISESSLATRLQQLQAKGIIERRPYQPRRYEYKLTSRGMDLWPTLVALTLWGDRWLGRDTPPLTYGCRHCGVDDAHPHLACESCGAALAPSSVTAHQSDDMQADRAARQR